MSSTTRQLRNRRHISQVEKEAALGRKEEIEHLTYTRSTGTTTFHHHHEYNHDSKEHHYWFKLGRARKIAVVAAAAACCSDCDNENPPSLNEARAMKRKARRAISAQLAGTVERTYTYYIFWPRG